MSDSTHDDPTIATQFWHDPLNRRWLATAGVLTIGLIAGGYLLGNGLVRAREADRAVTVRGLAEKDVTADLATWSLSFSASAPDLASAQADADRDAAAIRAFFKDAGFPAGELQPVGVNVSTYTENGNPKVTVRQRMTLRTQDIKRAQDAARHQFDLVRAGVELEDGSAISYSFTKLNAIKPEMIAAATRDARASAEQFAKDSGTSVGAIRSATQGYFSILDRDTASGDDSGGGWGAASTPYKKVRVVTTVEFSLR
ncbi:SIMPL domain-containing protein [Novosphingobium sp.]|uniref:SIMPL domain-containing protein n=1 Tax=Novosphingobium sp. TaxID=1874826 RepID=UPI0035B0662E